MCLGVHEAWQMHFKLPHGAFRRRRVGLIHSDDAACTPVFLVTRARNDSSADAANEVVGIVVKGPTKLEGD